MAERTHASAGWARWLRSDFMLSAAQNLYLVIAALTMVAALIGLIVAIGFEIAAIAPPPHKALPASYQAGPDSLKLSTVDAHLTPPEGLRFVVTIGSISKPLTEPKDLGYFDANAANGLAAYPDDFDVVGGKDADLFDRVNLGARAGLRPTPALITQINHSLLNLRSPATQSYRITVVARDTFGFRSAPTEVKVDLQLATAAPTSEANATPPTSDLELLARDIAQVLDPTHTPAYFDAYKRALSTPKQCGAEQSDAIFVANYRHSFDHVRTRLNASNIDAFYAGVCDGWREVQGNVAASEASRGAVMAENVGLSMVAKMAKSAAAIARNSALLFVGGALMLFMWISLFLAFLAIEGHTRVMRQAIEAGILPRRE